MQDKHAKDDRPGHLASDGQILFSGLVQLMTGAEVTLTQLSQLHLAHHQLLHPDQLAS